MKISFEKLDTREEIKAVVGDGGQGIFLPYGDRSIYMDTRGKCHAVDIHINRVAYAQPGRKPIYEGDTITITF